MNKEKILLIILPIFALAIGYVLYVDKFGGGDEPQKASDVDSKVYISPEDKDQYENKIDMKKKLESDEQKIALRKARTQSPSSFFERATNTNKEQEDKEDTIDLVDPDEPGDQSTDAVPQTKIVYVPVQKDNTKSEEAPKRRRTPSPANPRQCR